jgi:hypothetical protein
MNDERIACLQQIPGHGLAHDAETDKTDNGVCHSFSFHLLITAHANIIPSLLIAATDSREVSI